MGRFDNRQGALAEISAFFTKHLCVYFKENSNLGCETKSGGRHK